MENFDDRWKKTEDMFLKRFGKQPDMEAMLFLIGINELGKDPVKKKWSKEQKQDLMHIAVCRLLSQRGYYELVTHDEEGWPHYQEIKRVDAAGLSRQEGLLKECIIEYFGF